MHPLTRKLLLMVAVPGALLFGAIGTAQAVPFSVGDIFASTGSGDVQHYDNAGTLLETLNTGLGGFTTGSASDAAGNLYVTNFSSGSVSKFAGAGDPHTTSTFLSGLGGSPESIVFDAAGNVYIGNAGTNTIRKFDSGGNALATYTVAIGPRGTDWIDLASNQTTMFYTSEGGAIKRFDVGSNTQLADFASIGGVSFALRLLGDGGLLVANSTDVKRLDSTGAVTQTYDVAGENSWFALNLDPNGTSFWSGNYGTGNFYRFNIASGAQEDFVATGSSALYGLSLFGEITQSTGGGGTTVPEPASLALLGIGLAGLTAVRRKQIA